ncbi:MAG TPA: cyclic nucleotide-binding domain-containing protein [Anaerolineae bacterium]|nr:cyclic nucleotide-binding domain-containing protein [Anaerolineae bacterium]
MIESKYLKDDMHNIQQLLSVPSLKNFEIESLGKMLRLSKMRQYEDGEPIIKEGDMDLWLYVLLSGKVRVKKDGINICTLSRSGEIFGEMRILDKLSRSASVYAEGKTICLAVNIGATDKFSSDDEAASFLLLLYKVFAEYMSVRLRLLNEELVNIKKQFEMLQKRTDEKNRQTK